MSDRAIFLTVDGRLTPLRQAEYDNEAVLQQVLAEFPALIAGVSTADESPRLLLVRREMPVMAVDMLAAALSDLDR